MDQSENTKKIEKRQNEPAHRCQICESPNHYACGCEARAAKEKSRIDLNALPVIHYKSNGDNSRGFCIKQKPGEKTTGIEYEVTCPLCQEILKPKTGPYAEPEPEEIDEISKAILANEIFEEARSQSLEQLKYIKAIAGHFEDLFSMINDSTQFLKLIADDMITIRKILEEEYTELVSKSEKPNQPI